jgi:hypothetical protein
MGMGTHRMVPFGAPAAIGALALAVSPAGARIVACASPPHGHGPRNERSVNIGNVRARDMRCAAARKAISNGYLVGGGSGLETAGFRCYLVSQSVLGRPPQITGQTIRCVGTRRQRFRFSWAT